MNIYTRASIKIVTEIRIVFKQQLNDLWIKLYSMNLAHAVEPCLQNTHAPSSANNKHGIRMLQVVGQSGR